MGENYELIELGSLYVGGQIQENPNKSGHIPAYIHYTDILIVDTYPCQPIQWVKPKDMDLLVSDRILLNKISWYDLNNAGIVEGKPVTVDGVRFLFRLLRVGTWETKMPNEWDDCLSRSQCESDDLWHWSDGLFWGAEASGSDNRYRICRAKHNADYMTSFIAQAVTHEVGFRPAMELLRPQSYPYAPKRISLEGYTFEAQLGCMSSDEGQSNFCMTLRAEPNGERAPSNAVLRGVPSLQKMRAYTLLKDGVPVDQKSGVPVCCDANTKLTLTDRYFGDEYLITWVISNGVAYSVNDLITCSVDFDVSTAVLAN